MKKLNLRLLRFIKEMRGQVIATCLITLVGIMLYTALSSAAINLENTLASYYKEKDFPHIFIQMIKISDNKLKKFNLISEIHCIEGRVVIEVPMKVKKGEDEANLRFISYNAQNKLNKLHLIEGSMPRSTKEVVLLDRFAKDRSIKVGDEIKTQINKREYSFKVVGTVYSPEYIYLMENEQSLIPAKGKFGVIFCEEEFLQKAIAFNGSFNSLLIKLNNSNDIDIVETKLKEHLDKYGLKRIVKRENQLSNKMISEEIMQLKKTSGTVPVIFLFISAVIIYVIISKMVNRDRITIGILKSMGFSNKDILLHYTKYSLFIGIIGALLGSLLGLLLAGVMTNLYIAYFNLPLSASNIYYRYILLSVILTGIISIVSGMMGAYKSIKIMPADAMRPEAPINGKRILLENMVSWNKLSFSWKVAIRNIFRSKKRFMTITMGVAVTYMVTLFPFFQLGLLDSMFMDHYGNFQKMDFNINFSKPLKEEVIVDLKNITKVDNIEGKIEYPFEIENGWKSKVVNIIGVQEDTKFFLFKNTSGKEISISQEGIYLTENLAKSLNVKKGDLVTIKNFIPYRKDIQLKVVDIINQSLGINGYMNKSYMEEFLVDKKMITGAYIKSERNLKDKIRNIRNINSVESRADLIETTKEFMKITVSSVSVLVIFAAILGFGIIYNATVMNISERTSEFSTLQILGFSKLQIFKMLLKETIVMIVLGIIIGFPMSTKLVEIICDSLSSELYTMNGHVGIKIHIVTIIMIIIFVVFSQVFTLKKIHNLDLLEALKRRIA